MTTMSDVHQLMKNVAYWKARAEAAERERNAALAEVERLKVWASDSHVTELEVQLARVLAAVEALPPAMPHDRAIRRAAVLALLDREET